MQRHSEKMKQFLDSNISRLHVSQNPGKKVLLIFAPEGLFLTKKQFFPLHHGIVKRQTLQNAGEKFSGNFDVCLERSHNPLRINQRNSSVLAWLTLFWFSFTAATQSVVIKLQRRKSMADQAE